MRLQIIIFALLAAVSLRVFGLKADRDELPRLINQAQSAPIGRQPSLYANIAERELRLADQLYTADDIGRARAAVENVVTYSDKASNAAIQSGKHLKNTEISMRKMSFKLRDMKRQLSFKDQSPLQDASDHLETLRTSLLSHMFKKKK